MTNRKFNKAIKGIDIDIVKSIKEGEMYNHNDDYHLYAYIMDCDCCKDPEMIVLKRNSDDEEIAVLLFNIDETRITYQMLI